ncbi:MAG: twin-arginine translocase subunit TatC [Gammaproteobacteria bacterium]|nr:twin-arginine translocase subunit TatC [Gammaproteobacteria bacterium]
MSKRTKPTNPAYSELPLVGHLIELRTRLIRALLVVAVFFAIMFPFANEIYSFVAEPLMRYLPKGSTMIATEVASPFLTPFKFVMYAALFAAIPAILYQLWAFVAPGLYHDERELAMPLLVSSVLLFYTGVAFCYFLVFPLVFQFFTSTTPDGVSMMTDISKYLDFVLGMFLAFGLAFEVPVATIILVLMGIFTPQQLVEKRSYVIVGAFIVGMILSPPDIFSQTLLAVPMWLLFEVGVLVSRTIMRRKEQRERQAASAETRVTESTPATAAGVSTDANFRPLTPEEMDAELDQIAQQQKRERDGGGNTLS